MNNNKQRLLHEFINNPKAMRKAKSIVVNRYNIDAQEADSIIFAGLSAAVGWWKEDREASFETAVFTAVTTHCLLFKRTQGRYRFADWDSCLEPTHAIDGERTLHFKQLLSSVMDKIIEVEDEEQRCILICIMLYGDAYDDVSPNPTASRKMVERFRQGLKDTFKDDIEWG